MFARRIERVDTLGASRAVPVANSSEAAWVQDASGRAWVIKWEENTGFQELIAEALSWMIGDQIGVLQPRGAVFVDGSLRAWMSERVPNVVHWNASHAHLLTNADQLGAALALDAITLNEDRHAGNILLQPNPDELHLKAFAIDSGDALIGRVDFHGSGLRVPTGRNLAPGIPLDLVSAGAMAAAVRAATLDRGEILEMVTEACDIARDPGRVPLEEALAHRLKHAPDLVAEYLAKLKSPQR